MIVRDFSYTLLRAVAGVEDAQREQIKLQVALITPLMPALFAALTLQQSLTALEHFLRQGVPRCKLPHHGTYLLGVINSPLPVPILGSQQ